MRLHRRLDLEPLAFLHQRIHQISLTPLCELALHKCGDIRLLGANANRSDHLSAPRRFFIQNRNIKIAIQGHRQRARNRRRSHHQHIRRCAPADQCRALTHAELVLLVDHHQSEILKISTAMDQGMRANNHLRMQPIILVGALIARRGAQGDANPQRLKPLAKCQKVLLCKDLRRRHQRGLRAGVDRHQHRCHRDKSFSRAHIPLHQARHRPWVAHVLNDLTNRPLLRPCQIKGQARVKFLQQGCFASMCAPLEPVMILAPPKHIELHGKKFLERKPAARGLRDFKRIRKVHRTQIIGPRNPTADIDTGIQARRLD